MAEALIIQFAKAPLPGKVKTRLQPVLGEAACVDLHKALLETSLQKLSASGLADYELCVTEDADNYFHRLTAGINVSLAYQEGANLGERMANALCRGLQNYHRVVVVGSDCPCLDKAYVAEALAALEQESDAVFGPALDGGYVLVGLSRFNRDLFAGIAWGTDQVMVQTRQKLRQQQLQWQELVPLPDIDEEQDLGFLQGIGKLQKFSQSFQVTI